jgi:hypothetical protein
MGITTSKGVACDFQGPYSVGDRGRMAFGRATRAVRIDVTSLPGEYISAPAVNNNIRYVPSDLRFMIHSCNIYTQFSTNATIMAHTHIHTHTGGAEQWDKAIAEANAEYRTRMHNICCDNCHSHVAYALNNMEVKAYGIRQWDMVKLCFLIFLKGRFLSLGGFLAQFLPFGVVVLIILLVKLI